ERLVELEGQHRHHHQRDDQQQPGADHGQRSPVHSSDFCHSAAASCASRASAPGCNAAGAPHSSNSPRGPMNSPPSMLGAVAAYSVGSAPLVGGMPIAALPRRTSRSFTLFWLWLVPLVML